MDQADGKGDGGCGEDGWGSPLDGSDSGVGLVEEEGGGGSLHHRRGGGRRSAAAAAARASSMRLLVPDARRGTLQLLVSRQDSCLVKLRWYEREPEGAQRYR